MGKKKIIQEKAGSAVFAFAVGFLLFMMIVAFFIKALPLYDKYSRLNSFGKEILRTAELSGRIDREVKGKISAMKAITKLDPKITWSQSGKVPLGEEIEVALELEAVLVFGGNDIVIPMKVELSGRSEVYWK